MTFQEICKTVTKQGLKNAPGSSKIELLLSLSVVA